MEQKDSKDKQMLRKIIFFYVELFSEKSQTKSIINKII